MPRSGSSKRKASTALAACRSGKPYMYSRLTRPAPAPEELGQAAGFIGHFDSDHVGDLHHEAFLLQERCALSHSRTTKRRMPNCCVSASERVRRLSWPGPAARRAGEGARLIFQEEGQLMEFHGEPGLHLAFVDDAFGFAFAALDGVRLDQPHGGPHADRRSMERAAGSAVAPAPRPCR